MAEKDGALQRISFGCLRRFGITNRVRALEAGIVSVRLHGKDSPGAKPKAEDMNVFLPKNLGVLTNLAANGPWRAKSVLAALAVVILGLGVWFHGLKSTPPQNEASSVVTNASGITPPNAAGGPAGSHWDWGKSFPFYVPMGASYVAGFFIGWLFRRLIRMVAVVGALVIGLLAFGRFAGCDTTHTQEKVKRSSAWAQHELTTTRNYFKCSLPWAAAGGAGSFFGFRRRSKAVTPKPVD